MNLNTEHLQRCIETLRSSIALYAQAPVGSIQQEVYRNAIVKGYELSQETSFKLLKKALREYGHSTRTLLPKLLSGELRVENIQLPEGARP